MGKIQTGRTLRERINDAIRAFRGKPVQTIQLGVKVVRCDECEPLCSLCGAKIEAAGPGVINKLIEEAAAEKEGKT
jgi:hypothetical protein